MRTEQIAPRNYSDHDTGLVAIHDGQAADALEHHVISRVSQRAVLVSDRWRALDRLRYDFIIGVSGIQKVAPGDNPDEQ